MRETLLLSVSVKVNQKPDVHLFSCPRQVCVVADYWVGVRGNLSILLHLNDLFTK